MKLDRPVNSREKNRLVIVHNSGVVELLHTRREKLRYTCLHSLLRFINIMRSRGVLKGDIEDLDSIKLTDEGRRLIGE